MNLASSGLCVLELFGWTCDATRHRLGLYLVDQGGSSFTDDAILTYSAYRGLSVVLVRTFAAGERVLRCRLVSCPERGCLVRGGQHQKLATDHFQAKPPRSGTAILKVSGTAVKTKKNPTAPAARDWATKRRRQSILKDVETVAIESRACRRRIT